MEYLLDIKMNRANDEAMERRGKKRERDENMVLLGDLQINSIELVKLTRCIEDFVAPPLNIRPNFN